MQMRCRPASGLLLEWESPCAIRRGRIKLQSDCPFWSDSVRLSPSAREWLRDGFTPWSVASNDWSGLTTSQEVKGALALLQGAGWVQPVTVPSSERGGPASVVYEVHPRVAEA